jgi:hypothetical protein
MVIGCSDVLIALEIHVKYDNDGKIESITITGYPAKHVNFRNPGDKYLSEMKTTENESNAGGIFIKIK